MTFGICLFIILMQFLWKYINDMVGKGLEMTLLLEMFFYAALSLVHMALPLSILLASLMTFGNLGESFELTAIKASGISLLKAMRPIIITISLVAIGAYFFQNNVMPVSQVKLWTIMRSMQQKSPELDIPEGSFYKNIPGYNLYVKKKDKKTGMLRDVMIYDFSNGFENAVVFVADSGLLKMSLDKENLVLTLYNGESFQNLSGKERNTKDKNIAYQRETFDTKSVFIEFDANFNMMDESIMQNQYIGKNRDQLRAYIDSAAVVTDSINAGYANHFREYGYMQSLKHSRNSNTTLQPDTFKIKNLDAYLENQSLADKISLYSKAKSRADGVFNEYQFRSMTQANQMGDIRRHRMELNRKFTLSFACLVFLFIGAPLGAIIRKGGLGMPVVISVFLFIFYYIINTFGEKMAKQGTWAVWQGMWLSSAVLFPLGVFLTHKAINDSAIFNPDTYLNAIKRILGKRETRNYAIKEVIMQYPDYQACVNQLEHLDDLCQQYQEHKKIKPSYADFWKTDFNQSELKQIINQMESIIEELCNSDKNIIVGSLMNYPVITPLHAEFLNHPIVRQISAFVLPIGGVFYWIGMHKRKRRLEDMQIIRETTTELKKEIQNINDVDLT